MAASQMHLSCIFAIVLVTSASVPSVLASSAVSSPSCHSLLQVQSSTRARISTPTQSANQASTENITPAAASSPAAGAEQAMVQSATDVNITITQPTSAAGTVAPESSTQSPMTALAQEATTYPAFAQISELSTEFEMLHKDDSVHVQQMGFNVKLRAKLRQQLRTAAEQLAKDNVELSEHTAGIVSFGAEDSQSNSTEDAQAGSALSAMQAGAKIAAAQPAAELVSALMQAGSTRDAGRLTSNQIAADADSLMKTLNSDIEALRTRDAEEERALLLNAKTRDQLSARVIEEREQLHKDAGSLVVDLGKIRLLAGGDAATPLPSVLLGGMAEVAATLQQIPTPSPSQPEDQHVDIAAAGDGDGDIQR